MTVLAIKNYVLAINRGVTFGDLYSERREAYFVCDDPLNPGKRCVISYTGAVAWALCWVEWFENGADPTVNPQYVFSDEAKNNDYDGLVLREDGSVEYWDRHLYPTTLIDPCVAFGSGREVAVGAMRAGASAVAAAKIATEVVGSCPGPVMWYNIRTKRSGIKA